jgi:hypothetical protein
MQLVSSTLGAPELKSSKTLEGSRPEESIAVTLMASMFQLSLVQPKHGPWTRVMMIGPKSEGELFGVATAKV